MAGAQRDDGTALKAAENAGKGSKPARFIRPSVLISTMSKRKLDSTERASLLGQIEEKIGYLKALLADNAAPLRRGVENHIVVMGGNRDEVGECGVSYADPAGGETITIEAQEAASYGSKGKIAKIADGCVALAKADLEFLEKAQKAISGGAAMPDADLRKLNEILGKNTFWRAITLI